MGKYTIADLVCRWLLTWSEGGKTAPPPPPDAAMPPRPENVSGGVGGVLSGSSGTEP
jgi:hypothetical protein